MMRAHFVASARNLPAGALVVDGFLPGAAASYSHWHGSPPAPPDLAADTSTQMLLLAARDPTRWLQPYTVACNDHVDADGLLAAAVACVPQLGLAHEDLLIRTAEAGDFNAWPGDDGLRLLLCIHHFIRTMHRNGEGWQERAYHDFPAVLPTLIAQHATHEAERDAQVAQVLAARRRLVGAQDVEVTIDPSHSLTTIAWQQQHGIGEDSTLLVHQLEDFPLASFDAVASPNSFQLLAMRQAQGTVYRLDAPRHSWARTVQRARVPWPDAGMLRDRLQESEPGLCHWVVRPQSTALGFVCLLASSDGAGHLAPSLLPLARVRGHCQEALDPVLRQPSSPSLSP